jgi:hypothetical protein
VGRGLRKLDITGDHDLEDLLTEMGANVLLDLVAQVVAAVVHG